jgi:hypothetical protein
LQEHHQHRCGDAPPRRHSENRSGLQDQKDNSAKASACDTLNETTQVKRPTNGTGLRRQTAAPLASDACGTMAARVTAHPSAIIHDWRARSSRAVGKAASANATSRRDATLRHALRLIRINALPPPTAW